MNKAVSVTLQQSAAPGTQEVSKAKSRPGEGLEASEGKLNLKETSRIKLTWLSTLMPMLSMNPVHLVSEKTHRAARMAFLLSAVAGTLKRSALFCSLCKQKR